MVTDEKVGATCDTHVLHIESTIICHTLNWAKQNATNNLTESFFDKFLLLFQVEGYILLTVLPRANQDPPIEWFQTESTESKTKHTN